MGPHTGHFLQGAPGQGATPDGGAVLDTHTVWWDVPPSQHATESGGRATADVMHPCDPLACLRRVPWYERWSHAPLAVAIRTSALNCHADQGTAVGCHRLTIVVPIGMLASQAAIIVDERFHRLR
jgi:hypothetical protein